MWILVRTLICQSIIRPDDMVFRPDLILSREASNCSSLHPSGCFSSPSERLSVFDQASGFLSKHRYGKIATTVQTTWIPIRTRSSIRPVSQFKSRHPDASQHGPDARVSNMEIACIISTVWTTISMVWTRKASIWKLLAADVRPSERQCTTVRTWLSNRKDFQRNFQNFCRTFVRLNDAQLYQAKRSFELSAYK
jgi:hypothetical protein